MPTVSGGPPARLEGSLIASQGRDNGRRHSAHTAATTPPIQVLSAGEPQCGNGVGNLKIGMTAGTLERMCARAWFQAVASDPYGSPKNNRIGCCERPVYRRHGGRSMPL
jgi:hypothetical protein